MARALTTGVFALLLPVLAVAGPAEDKAKLSRVKFDEGQRLMVAGDFDGAQRAFTAAWTASKNPTLLFYVGDAQRQGGLSSQALASLKRYLAQGARSPQKEQAEEWVAELEEVVARKKKNVVELDDLSLDARRKRKVVELDSALDLSASEAKKPGRKAPAPRPKGRPASPKLPEMESVIVKAFEPPAEEPAPPSRPAFEGLALAPPTPQTAAPAPSAAPVASLSLPLRAMGPASPGSTLRTTSFALGSVGAVGLTAGLGFALQSNAASVHDPDRARALALASVSAGAAAFAASLVLYVLSTR